MCLDPTATATTCVLSIDAYFSYRFWSFAIHGRSNRGSTFLAFLTVNVDLILKPIDELLVVRLYGVWSEVYFAYFLCVSDVYGRLWMKQTLSADVNGFV